MSEEFRQTHEMRERFMRAVYDTREPRLGAASQNDIMQHMGLDEDDPALIELYDSIAGYWIQRGLIESLADGYGLVQITADGIDQVEGRSQEVIPPSVTFNVGNAYGSIFGTQKYAQILQPTFTFGDLEQEIEERGGEDTEALKEMVRDIRTTLEQQESLGRRRLEGWSELLNRHAWITGPVAQLLLLYATTGQISG
jgi:hypothetical protein